MGSWTSLDANYPPGALTPATAFVVALGRLAGAGSVYADAAATRLAAFLPQPGPGYDLDVLTRAERYLREVPAERFLAEARALLNPAQKQCLALNLLDLLPAPIRQRPAEHAGLARILDGLGLGVEQIPLDSQAPALKDDMSLFPQ